ncbi:DNA polymerase III subunit gamma/tau [Microvirga sp. SRT01]|uniref:DNA polymerase III subunit gamma/tau n=1 Tax=Sphingomonas longa TaxID=2778730 RepID=A0ABS2D3Q7_9SPHN|nr:DNA polymerase III subunit gamma/tau [Microvirga sp. SRT01]MBM6574739.1 DNA polymerase III subunit gamma/tau [Sphingomonas sp. BT552]MBR7707791.1 DNA polymerase III subunit gamma/tau [Microvirga sp. SRT01]
MADSFDLGEPPQPVKAEAYRVLARKYRPQTFAELIGQDAMVTTLGNAIARDRLAHAFLMTGVRGVGKTSTARLIAKALNCIGPDGQGGPTIDPCGVCEPCRAIAEGRHIDVIEMDAASHTGVDDVREIIDASRYAAVSARFKIYIVDEVHMLSKNAFNALLKTLEEPPAHVKFLFATTEVNKVPITVLSRCQRFDLRRIPADKLAKHFAEVCEKEGVAAESEALALIARAAEGSARDGLSILDQAIAHAGLEGGGVTADAVRQMLGLSDRGAVRDLFAMLLAGDSAGALGSLRRQYDYGVDPVAVLRALLETVHGVTLSKVGGTDDLAQAVEERAARTDWAANLSFPALHRLWQLLLKGHDEVAHAALPIEAAEMALLRVIHASSLPDPGELARRLAGAPEAAPTQAPAPVPAAPPPPASLVPADFAALVDALDGGGQLALAARLRHGARLVRYAPPEIVFSGSRPIATDTLAELAAALKCMTKQVWKLSLDDVPGEPTLNERQLAADAAERQAMLDTPLVRAALAAFPGAELEWPNQRSTA